VFEYCVENENAEDESGWVKDKVNDWDCVWGWPDILINFFASRFIHI
jgi:hypothetical protein